MKSIIKTLVLITCVIGLNGCNIHNKTAETANTTDNTIIEISTETEPLKPNTTVETLIETPVSSTTKTTTVSSDEYTSSEDTKPKLGDTIIGMDGVSINITAEKKNDYYATFDTFTFYRESTGLIFYDNSYRDYKSEWKKAVPGDVFGSLVVSSVSAIYAPTSGKLTEDHSLGEYYAWCDREMSLSGSVALRGFLYADAGEGAFWEKSLFFRPTAKSLADNNFPTLRSMSICMSSNPYHRVKIYGDTNGDTQDFFLGSIDDFKDIIDWNEYTDEDNLINVYAEIELSDIEISYDTGTGISNIGKATMTKIIRVGSDEKDAK